ncbi:MAG: methionyl-tRNA formyltransferase [Clostridia bacterium]|nr:methionyl-tRNA formyltransferase [Clostridia bacterium]
MGTPEFARESLKTLVESGYNVVACLTNPDKPAGRGMKLKPSAVKEYAMEHSIPIYQPTKVRNNIEIEELLKSYEPDFIVVVAYGKILPKEILEIPKYGCINVHGSLLPKYRGAAPIQWAIINGEEETGITTMYMDVGMDTGDMLLKEKIPIVASDNLGSVHDKLMVIGANLLIKTLDGILDDTIERIKQSNEFSVAPMLNKETTKIDFNNTGKEIFNLVRGLSPFPGTYTTLKDGRVFKIYDVQCIPEENLNIDLKENSYKNGEVVYTSKDKLYIKCKEGYISVFQIQPQNSKRMNIQSFMAGNKVKIGEVFN